MVIVVSNALRSFVRFSEIWINDSFDIVFGTVRLSTRRRLVATRRRTHSLAGVTGLLLFLAEGPAKADDTKVIATIIMVVAKVSPVFILFILISLVI